MNKAVRLLMVPQPLETSHFNTLKWYILDWNEDWRRATQKMWEIYEVVGIVGNKKKHTQPPSLIKKKQIQTSCNKSIITCAIHHPQLEKNKQPTFLPFKFTTFTKGMICQSSKFGCLLQKKEIRLSGGRCTLVLCGCWGPWREGGWQRLGLREINVSSINKTPEEARNTPSFAKHLQEWSIDVVKRIGKGHICRDWTIKHGGRKRSNIFAIRWQFHVELPELTHMLWLKRESVHGSVWWDGQLPEKHQQITCFSTGLIIPTWAV